MKDFIEASAKLYEAASSGCQVDGAYKDGVAEWLNNCCKCDKGSKCLSKAVLFHAHEIEEAI